MDTSPVWKLRGVVQHYAWGGYEFIPSLLGIANPARKPFAELWMGAHPSAPALVETTDGLRRLDELIDSAPQEILGRQAAEQFGNRLPYLFKILDARQMLSIQAHPTKRQAEEGYARENAAGVPLHAPTRNYKDDSHKPEVHVALTDFWMLHGFRPEDQVAETLRSVPEFHRIPNLPVRELYKFIMTAPQEWVDGLIDRLISRLTMQPPVDRNTPDFWALRAAEDFPLAGGHRDRGILAIYLLNLVHLRPGQGTFQPAGVLHAYLEGTNVELMANSDNVLRGGLTPKHVDVPELMRILCPETGDPEFVRPVEPAAFEGAYRTGAREFEVSHIRLPAGERSTHHAANGPETVVALEGCARLNADRYELELARGAVAFLRCGTRYTLESGRTPAQLFKAAIP